jgi:hypothetical protein
MDPGDIPRALSSAAITGTDSDYPQLLSAAAEAPHWPNLRPPRTLCPREPLMDVLDAGLGGPLTNAE